MEECEGCKDLRTTVEGLQETVANLAPTPEPEPEPEPHKEDVEEEDNTPDSTPTSVPWTHRGGGMSHV